MPEVLIVDYGVGNLLSLKCALEKAGLTAKVGLSRRQLKNADAIALPGVGNFVVAATKLAAFREDFSNVVREGTPIFGICLGLQLFFQESEEGQGEGLALLRGKNVRLPNSVKIPHMGWNTLQITEHNEILDAVNDGTYMYFVHSLYPVPIDKEIICTQTDYGTTFTSTISRKNVFGTQFHPEKSGENGLQILKNFAKVVAR